MTLNKPLYHYIAYSLGFISQPNHSQAHASQLTKELSFKNPILPPTVLAKVKVQLQIWKNQNYQVLCPECKDYPQSLLQLNKVPPLIFVLGNFTWKSHFNLAIVGRRNLSLQSQRWLQNHLHKFLKNSQSPMNIISGGARGVDQLAHKASLLCQQPTTVVLPSGLDKIYPQSLLPLVNDIIKAGGCLISTYLPPTPMYKSHFHGRNEIIAALCDSALIIEAEKRSGTYKTALYCQNLSRSLGVVPGFPEQTSFSGSLQLLYDGAQMIRDQADLKCFTDSQSLPLQPDFFKP